MTVNHLVPGSSPGWAAIFPVPLSDLLILPPGADPWVLDPTALSVLRAPCLRRQAAWVLFRGTCFTYALSAPAPGFRIARALYQWFRS